MRTRSFWIFFVVILRSFFIVILTLLANKVFAQVDEKALEILEKTSAYYQGLENFRATYDLVIKYPEEDITQSSKLTIIVRGHQYRLSYDQKETITDGETIWVYDKEMKEVTISDYDKTNYSLNFADLYNLYQYGYLFFYVQEHVLNKRKNIIRDVVQLIPSSEDSAFKSITLEIDRASFQIHKWEIVQNEEIKYVCTINSFAANIPLSDDYFKFDIHVCKDLEIIDLRENEEDISSPILDES
ncbi:LolA family protein [Cardinium endosymbiont of Culicoides punctatus]|uniref:LolA family protein n=1 Tax=Cardinium endosymbiont of Culicoides punctatus TaxID=2304601 RepID=UPI00105848D9|nr:outer membrane lipoprotein carrier protein LolA [Cardinium endosymbiont of Culicoides punctatus]TDG93286.1 Outer-membrane lipoprotein carrier protein [Cardinium endosymbiont of Culicoides punctatus]